MPISVLVPSRQRPDLLRRSIASLGEGDYEVLVRIDDDDRCRGQYEGLPNLVVGPSLGYGRLHHYYNELCERARGEWLFVWNDDCLMETPNWVDVVRSYDDRFVVLNPETNHNNWAIDMNVFPIVPRAIFEVTGHLSLNRHTDSWLEDIGRQLRITAEVPIRIHHDRADLTGQNADAVYAARDYDQESFHSREMVAARRRDAARLRKYRRSRRWSLSRRRPA